MSELKETNKSEATKPTVKIKPEFPSREITLNRSKIKVTIPVDWHVSDTQAAQRASRGETGRLQLALIQRVCLFGGEHWTMDDIEERLTGRDWMQLLGEFYGDDEDEAGNE